MNTRDYPTWHLDTNYSEQTALSLHSMLDLFLLSTVDITLVYKLKLLY